MGRLRRIITNPIGIALLIVNCGVLIYCLVFEDVPIFVKKSNTFSLGWDYNPIFDFLISINFFSVIIIDQIVSAISFVFGRSEFLNLLLAPLFLILIVFQWLLVGYFITKFIESNRKLEDVKFSLKND